MQPHLRRAALAAALSLSVCACSRAEDPKPAPAPKAAEEATVSPTLQETQEAIQSIAKKIVTKLKAGAPKTEAGIAEELAELEALHEKVKARKNEEVAFVLGVKASIQAELLDNPKAALVELARIREELPGHPLLASVSKMEAQIKEQGERAEKVAKLVGSPAPGLDFTWSSRDGLKSLADLKGKVVVLDFWATWCGPCVASFPEVRELTAHYKGSPVEVVGVTSIQGAISGLEAQPISTKDDPKKEIELLGRFAKEKDVTWTVAVSQQDVFNPDYGIEGIPHMVILAPDGTLRHSGIHPSSPLKDKTDKIDAILKEFGLAVPAGEAK